VSVGHDKRRFFLMEKWDSWRAGEKEKGIKKEKRKESGI
jgi:hypothetical protein